MVSQQNKIKGKLYHRGKKNEGSPRYQQKNMDLKEQMNGFVLFFFVAALKYFELVFSSLEGLRPCL